METSRIMRTTIDIDDPIFKELKRLQRREGKSLGRLVSDMHDKDFRKFPFLDAQDPVS